MTPNIIFDDVFKNVVQVPFERSWHGLEVQYERLISDPSMALIPGRLISTIDHARRRALIRGTNHGNLVLFERYAKGNGPYVISGVASRGIHMANRSRPLSIALNDAMTADSIMYYLSTDL